MRILSLLAISIVVLETNGIVFDHYESTSKAIYNLSSSQPRQLNKNLEVNCGNKDSGARQRNGLGLRRGETAIVNGGEFLVKCQ